MGVLLALGSSVAYGVADFAGGLLSRRASFLVVALVGQAAGLVLGLALVLALPSSAPTGADLAWGALSGVGTGLGMLHLYRGMSRGDMSVVVPIAAVGGVALPVLVGVVLLHDRPTALSWLGIAAAIPGIWLVSRSRGPARDGGSGGVPDALLASVWIALQYAALAQAGGDAGLWPIVTGRLTAVLAILPVAVAAAPRERPSSRILLSAVGAGAAATLALFLYLLATHVDLMTIAVVLSSLYPAIPVVLGVTLLGERLGRGQQVGLLAATAAVVLIAVG